MRTVGDVVRYSAKYYPDKLATVYQDIRLTYSELNERVNRVANGLLKLGVKKGDHVGVVCHTSHYFQELIFGVVQTGAILSPINWRLTAREIQFIANDAEMNIIFVAERYWAQVEPIKDKLPKLKHIIMIGDPIPGTIHYEQFLANSAKDEIEIDVERDDVAWQLYTSGTTGRPKGVMLTHRNLLTDTEHNIIGCKYNTDEDGVWIHAMPLFHIAARRLIVTAYLHITIVLMDKFDVEEFCKSIEKEKCTFTTMAPQMWQRLLDDPAIDKYDLSSLKHASYSTAPMPVVLLRRMRKKFPGITFFTTYGLTEAGSSLTILPADQYVDDGPDYLVKRIGSLGRPMYGVDIRVIDDKGMDCPPGVVGEIIGRGDNIMKGYWKLSELPQEAHDTLRNGWLYTGDMAYQDEYGYLYMSDRKKDLIVSGGENIYPKEVEDVIREVKGVSEVVVIGVPSDKWGEAVKAIVIKEPGAEVTGGDIINYCSNNLAGYKKPQSVDFTDDFPRTTTGKILKKDIRARYWEGKEVKV